MSAFTRRDYVFWSHLSLGFVWLLSGASSAFFARSSGLAILAEANITGVLASYILFAASSLDIVIGLWAISGWRQTQCLKFQVAIIVSYTLLLSFLIPAYWLHPFGVLSKNLPILMLVLLLLNANTDLTKK